MEGLQRGQEHHRKDDGLRAVHATKQGEGYQNAEVLERKIPQEELS